MIMLIFGIQSPAHFAGRHLPCKYSIYLAANSTPYVVLTIHLLLQAYLVKAVICAFSHNNDINRNLASNLLLVHFFHFLFIVCAQAFIELAHANGAGFLIVMLTVALALFLSDFKQQFLNGHFDVAGHSGEGRGSVVCERLRKKVC